MDTQTHAATMAAVDHRIHSLDELARVRAVHVQRQINAQTKAEWEVAYLASLDALVGGVLGEAWNGAAVITAPAGVAI